MGGDHIENAWKELVERLLDHGYPGAPEMGVEVLLGELPRDVAWSIPIPHGWRVVGSSLRRMEFDHPAQTLEVVIDADGLAAQAVADFATAAEAAGWRKHEERGPMHGGFISGNDGEARSFERDDVVVRIVAMQRTEGSVDVRIHSNTDEIRRWQRAPHGFPEAAHHLPTLRAPQGVRLATRGGGGSQDHYQQDASIDDAELTVAEVQSHFSSQLEAAGWQLLHRGGDDRVGWSAWRLPDERWHGLLLVLNASGGRRLNLLLRVDAADDAGDGDGSFRIVRSRFSGSSP